MSDIEGVPLHFPSAIPFSCQLPMLQKKVTIHFVIPKLDEEQQLLVYQTWKRSSRVSGLSGGEAFVESKDQECFFTSCLRETHSLDLYPLHQGIQSISQLVTRTTSPNWKVSDAMGTLDLP